MKFFSAMIICCILLCGCSSKSEDFFSYQNRELSFECTLIYNGHENEAKISMSAPNEEGKREIIRVEYISPQIIRGYTLEKSNGQYKGKMGDIEIPFGERAAGVVQALEYVFSIEKDMLSGIETAESGMTEAEFISDTLSGKVVMNESGQLVSIIANLSNGSSISVKLKQIQPTTYNTSD